MPNSLFVKPPPGLPVLATFLLLVVGFSREASVVGGLPVFLSDSDRPAVYVELTGTVSAPGVYQFYDAVTLVDVIKLTGVAALSESLHAASRSHPLVNGNLLHVHQSNQNNKPLQLRWMPAAHRLALGIPLHPDHMSREDWMVLPGIGEVLAERIELNRQKYGDFGKVEALVRVLGIGEKRVLTWAPFFSSL